MRESSSLTSLKQATEQRILMGKSASLGNLHQKVTKFSFDLKLPGRKAQSIKRLKEYFTKQIEIVGLNNQINEEMLALQQTLDRMRDQLLLPVNHELKKLVSMIEQAEDKLDFEIKIQGFSTSKLEQLKENIKKFTEEFSFVVTSENKRSSDLSKKKPDLVFQASRGHVPTPVKQSFLSDTIGRSKSHEKITLKNVKDADTTASKRQIDSQKPIVSSSQPRFPVIEVAIDPGLLEVDIDDKHFNEFLESELERIKKKFLDDEPSRGAKARQSKSISENHKVKEPASEGRVKSSKKTTFDNHSEVIEKKREANNLTHRTPDPGKGRKDVQKYGSTRGLKIERR